MAVRQEFEGQHADEEVQLVFRRHPIVMRKGIIITLVCILIGAIVGSFLSAKTVTTGEFFTKFFTPVGIGLALGSVFLLYYWIGWYYSLCIVTDQRFRQIVQSGMFSRSVYDVQLGKIQNVSYEVQGLLETMLGFGTIVVQTLVGDLVVRKVSHPAKRQAEIISVIKENGVTLSEEAEL